MKNFQLRGHLSIRFSSEVIAQSKQNAEFIVFQALKYGLHSSKMPIASVYFRETKQTDKEITGTKIVPESEVVFKHE